MNRHDDKTIKDTAPRRPPAGRPTAGRWGALQPGELLADGTYRVMEGPIGGSSMGRIYRVHHTGWGMDLAMKQPDPRLFADDQEKKRFIENECALWMEIGYHPSIVTCYYVRDMGGVPSIFSEWMEGSNLKHLIGGGKGALYSGPNPLSRILEIAIQTARGLQYAQEKKGLIHRDVKPSNILLDAKGRAKVGDFGLALGGASSISPREARMGTKEYSSPEQQDGHELTGKTDIYSFGVTLLEMFLGARHWDSGPVAGYALEKHLRLPMKVPMPQAVQLLLRECLRTVPGERFRSFDLVAAVLREVFKEQGCIPSYPDFWQDTAGNAVPPQETADNLNNRALSYLDIGNSEKALKYWDEALRLDVSHAESTYNRALYLWRQGIINDLEAIDRMETVAVAEPYKAYRLMAHLHLERGDAETAQALLYRVDHHATGERVPKADYALVKSFYSDEPATYTLPDTCEYYDLQISASGSRVLCQVKPPEDWPKKNKFQHLYMVYDLEKGGAVHPGSRPRKAASRRKLWRVRVLGQNLLARLKINNWRWLIRADVGPLVFALDSRWKSLYLSGDGRFLWAFREDKSGDKIILERRRTEDFSVVSRCAFQNRPHLRDLYIDEEKNLVAIKTATSDYTPVYANHELLELYSLPGGELLGKQEIHGLKSGFWLPGLQRCMVLDKNAGMASVRDMVTGNLVCKFEYSDIKNCKSYNFSDTLFPVFRSGLEKTPVELWNHHTGQRVDTLLLDDKLNEYGIVLPGDRYFLYTAEVGKRTARLFDIQEKRVIRSFPRSTLGTADSSICRPVFRNRFGAVYSKIYGGPATVTNIPEFPYRAAWQLCTVDRTDARAKAEREGKAALEEAALCLSAGQKAKAYDILQKLGASKGVSRSARWTELYHGATSEFEKTDLAWCRLDYTWNCKDSMRSFVLSADESFAVVSCCEVNAKNNLFNPYLRVVDLMSGTTSLQFDTDDNAVALSPDGNWLACNRKGAPCFYNLKTGETHYVDMGEYADIYKHLNPRGVGYTPDGRCLYANGFLIDAQTFKPIEWLFGKLSPDNLANVCPDTYSVQFTPDGSIMLLYSMFRRSSNYYLCDLKAYTLHKFRSPPFGGGHLSPDGKRFAYTEGMGKPNQGWKSINIQQAENIESLEKITDMFSRRYPHSQWGEPAYRTYVEANHIGPVSFSSDGRFLISTMNFASHSNFGFVLIDTLESERANCETINVEATKIQDIFDIQFSSDGNFVYCAGKRGFSRWELGWNYDVSEG